MNKGFPGLGMPYNELLGAGAVYANYGLSTEFRIGASKGGNEFNDNAEFHEREGDGDMGSVKGAIDLLVLRPQLTMRSLRIDAEAVQMYYAGMRARPKSDGVQNIYRTANMSDAYIDNVAFVGVTRGGNPIVIIIDDAIGLNAVSLSFAKGEETVPEIIFTGTFDPATFDPEDEETYPYHVQFLVGTVQFTVTDDETPAVAIEGATILLTDGQLATTDESGQASFDCTYGKVGYTITKSGQVTATGIVTVDSASEAVSVAMTASA